MKIGIIAEDDSDVDVVREMTLTLLKPHRPSFRRFVGNGCGKLRRKCSAWVNILIQEGYPWVIVAHDLDQNSEQELRTILTQAIESARPIVSVVLLPKREIEAWLLYNASAIASAFGEVVPVRLPSNPESLQDAKKHHGLEKL